MNLTRLTIDALSVAPPVPLLLFLNPEIPRTVNFVIFAGILIYFLREPMRRFLNERVEAIRRGLAEARAKKDSVEARLREIESRLQRLDAEIAGLKAEAEKEAEAERARIRKATEAEVDKLRALAHREIDGAKSAALLELKSFAASKSVELAEALIQAEMKVEDDRRLVVEFAERLQEMRR